MTLISLILVLAAERIATQSKYWQADTYTQRFIGTVESQNWLGEKASVWGLLAVLAIPSLVLFFVLGQINSNLLTLIIDTAILMVCIGCPALRATYKCFLQAANRGDMQACSMYSVQLRHSDTDNISFGQSLVWLNYQHYAGVVIWFAVFGAPGAMFYVLTREIHQSLAEKQHPLSQQAEHIMGIVDWVPVRITALGFLLVGHFSRALPVWLGYFPDPSVSAKTLLSDVSKAAEEVEPDERDCTEEPCTLVRLAKRNIMFIVVVISVLTLSGWLD